MTAAIFTPDSEFVQAIAGTGDLRRQMIAAGATPNPADACEADPAQVARLCNDLFWASLATVEGCPVRTVVCIASPEECAGAFRLRQPRRADRSTFVALAAAADGSALAVHAVDAVPHVWGLVPQPVLYRVALRVAAAGTLVALRGLEVLAFAQNGETRVAAGAGGASLLGVICEAVGGRADAPTRLRRAYCLLEIAKGMLRHGRGGAIVVLPADDAAWPAHADLEYEFDAATPAPPWQDLTVLEEAAREAHEVEEALLLQRPVAAPELVPLRQLARDATAKQMTRSLQRVATLTARDGAVVLNDELRVLGFGAKLRAHQDCQVTLLGLVSGSGRSTLTVAETGGTRHQSAVRFVAQNRRAVVFVASQDGNLTLFLWDGDGQAVVGLRELQYVI